MHEMIARVGRRASPAGRISVVAIALAVAGLGCAGRGGGDPFLSQADARINIEVVNHSFQDATVHAVWPGQRRRLGIVSATNTANFMLPWTYNDMLRIEIRLLAGRRCTTRQIATDPGDIIFLEIFQDLRLCGL